MSRALTYLHARYEEEAADARTVPQYNGDELWVLDPQYDYHDHTRVLWISPAHVLADLAAKRKILALHEASLTTDAYRRRLGQEPPTSPIIRIMLQPYAGRTDFDPAWRES